MTPTAVVRRAFDPRPPLSRIASFLLALALPVVLSACGTPAPAPASARMHPFASDGCSMFPNHSPIGKADWCVCCVAHDIAYWRGGTANERERADEELERCVRAASDDATLAATMHAGVRAGGLPYFPTGYRWGYGWPYGRGYAPLTPDENDQAARLRARYLSEHPVLTCPGPAPVVTGR